MADKDFVVKNGLVTGTNNVTVGNSVYIITSGNVGIHNSAPAHDLSVNGLTFFGDSISSSINLSANSTGVYHTGTINAASHTVGTSTVANATGVYTGVVNATSVNAASHTVGTSTVANATGVYTGVVNAASHTVGTSTVANSTGVYTGVVNATAVSASNLTSTTNTTTIGTSSYFVSNGNVGVGTATPGQKLVVSGNASVQNRLFIGGNTSIPNELVISDSVPVITIQESDGVTDGKNWDDYYDNGTKFSRLVNDDYNAANNYMLVTRTGMNVSYISFPLQTSYSFGLPVLDTNVRYRFTSNFTQDSITFGLYNISTINNTAITIARPNYSLFNQLINKSLSSTSGGSILNSIHVATESTVDNGDPTTGGDAYSNFFIGTQSQIRNYANGTSNSTITNSQGFRSITQTFRSGSIGDARGFYSYIAPAAANSTVTGNITTAYGYCTDIGLNSSNASIGTGFLYYGAYVASANVTGVKYGIYLNNETTNYFSGNVGIGTASPDGKLHVYRNSGASPAGFVATLQQDTSTGAGTNSNTLLRFYGYNGSNVRDWRLGIGSSSLFGTHDNFGIYDSTAAATRLVIDTDGDVGIGTTAPSQKLQVAGSIYLSAGNGTGVSFASDLSAHYLKYDAALDGVKLNGYSGVVFETLSTERMRIDSSGNVGIGTSVPVGKLSVTLPEGRAVGTAWDNKSALFGSIGAFSGALGISFDTANGAILESAAPGVASYPISMVGLQIQMVTAGSERMRIDASGNVGIGTTTAAERLTVVQNQNAQTRIGLSNQDTGSLAETALRISAFGGYWDLAVGSTANNSNALTFNVSGIERMRLSANGNVGIGTASPSEKLEVNGNVKISSNLVTGSSSRVSGGFGITSYNIGTLSSGTTTLNPFLGNYQYYTNNGAHTIAAPTSDCAIDIFVTNGASAGSITLSGFTAPAGGGGDTYATTNGNRYLLMIRRINAISTYVWKALQ